MGDVQVTFNVGGKTYSQTVPEGTKFMDIDGNTQTAKKGATIKLDKQQYQFFAAFGKTDGKAGLSTEDFKKFNSMSKQEQVEYLNKELAKYGNYRVGTLMGLSEDDEGNVDVHSKKDAVYVGLTPGGKDLPIDDPNAKYLGVYLDTKQ